MTGVQTCALPILIGTYPFVRARLYSVVGGKGASPVAAPAVKTGDDVPMTAEQEKQAYEIVLNREPEITVPSGRTAMQFIVDAKNELANARTNAAAQLAAALGQATDWQKKYEDLLTQQPQPTLSTPAPGTVVVPTPTVADPVVTSLTDPKPFDTITAAQRIHSVSSQGFGIWLKIKRAIHNAIFQDKIKP